MTSARDFSVTDTLRNGTVVTIRAVRTDDRERLVEAFSRLERETVYRRFFVYRNELGEKDLAHIAAMDFVRDVMLVATIPTPTLDVIIGGGRYVASDAPGAADSAEVAFLIEEDHQGIGLAGRLLRHLVSIARASGIKRFEADVLPDNRGMLAVFERSGLPMRRQREEGLVHVTLALDGTSATAA